MNLQENELANLHHEVLAENQASATAYQLRTECMDPCEHIRAILRPWQVSWKETLGNKFDHRHVAEYGVLWASIDGTADTDVQLIVDSGVPSLNEIRSLLGSLTHCHVAAESCNSRELYTGEQINI